MDDAPAPPEEGAAAPLPSVEDCARRMSAIFDPSPAAGVTPREGGINPAPSARSPRPSSGVRSDAPGDPDRDGPANGPGGADSANGTVRIGRGGDAFEVKISVDECRDLHRVVERPTPAEASSDVAGGERKVWLSYRFFGTVVQSAIFSISESSRRTDGFAPMVNAFRVRSSLPELVDYFNIRKNGTLRIYLCMEGEVLGSSSVNLSQLVAFVKDKDRNCKHFEGRMVQNEYIMKSRSAPRKADVENGSRSQPRIAVRMCIDLVPTSVDRSMTTLESDKHWQCAVYSSVSSQTIKTASVDRASSPMRKGAAAVQGPCDDDPHSHQLKYLEEREERLKANEAALSNKEKEMYEVNALLEKKRCEWEQWRHRQELEWHENLRSKEAEMVRAVEERARTIERERLSSMEASKSEYEKLEARLRKTLIEVEAKERQLKDTDLGYQNERKRKLAELELREKLMKEELKHSVEIERAKVNAAVEQAVVAEKSAAAANKKVKQIEAEMDQLREHHRKTPEVQLMQQLAEFKGRLADSERRVEAMKAEKNQVTAEKEQFRSNVHKLARALRHERGKAIAKRENANQGVRLSYDAQDKSFVLDGGQDKIQRILTDLNRISQIRVQPGRQSPVTSPMANRPVFSGQDLTGVSDVMQKNDVPPAPSPQPSHPTPNRSTHPPKLGS